MSRDGAGTMLNSTDTYPPAGYRTPPFPSLHWPPQDKDWGLYGLRDMWRFTLLWTLVTFAIFHWSVAAIAVLMQVGKRRWNWRFVWMVPVAYTVIAAVEAVCAGSLTGVMVGIIYRAGGWYMSTWIPFIWAWVNALVLVVSSFTIQGGL